MNKSTKLQNLKQNFYKERRKQELEKIFSQKRKAYSKQLIEKENQKFRQILPLINEGNYEQNRFLLNDFAKSSQYSYELLPITSIVYQFLLKHQQDELSWQILTYLSYYQDFQIPQGEEFTQMLLYLLSKNSLLGSQLLLNLSRQLSKYGLLCCRLIDHNILRLIFLILKHKEEYYFGQCCSNKSFQYGDKQQTQSQISNFLFILSYFFTIMPTLDISLLKQICQILNLQTRSNKFLKEAHTQAKYRLISNAIQRYSQQNDIFNLLFDQFCETITLQFFTYQFQSIKFLKCCVKSKVSLSLNLIKNIFLSIKSKNTKKKVLALQVIHRILDISEQKEKMQVQNSSQLNIDNFIQSGKLPSFEEFNNMYQCPQQERSKSQISSNQIKNCLMVYSLFFNENYELQLTLLFQIYQSSSQKIQEEIVKLVKKLVQCLMRQIESYQPQKLLQAHKEIYNPENMEQFLIASVEQEEFFIFLSECLKSSHVAIIEESIQIIRLLLCYFKQDVDEQKFQSSKKINFQFLINQINKVNIYSILEHLYSCSDYSIKDPIEQVLELLDSNNN